MIFRSGVTAYRDCMGPIIKKAAVTKKCPDLVAEMYTALSKGYLEGYNYLCKDGFQRK